MRDYPKHIKRKLIELKYEAHERELARELTKLADRFDDWKAGRIGAGELNELIHQHHNGPSRELLNFYNNVGDNGLAVVCAITKGILREDEIPEDVWSHIERFLPFSFNE